MKCLSVIIAVCSITQAIPFIQQRADSPEKAATKPKSVTVTKQEEEIEESEKTTSEQTEERREDKTIKLLKGNPQPSETKATDTGSAKVSPPTKDIIKEPPSKESTPKSVGSIKKEETPKQPTVIKQEANPTTGQGKKNTATKKPQTVPPNKSTPQATTKQYIPPKKSMPIHAKAPVNFDMIPAMSDGLTYGSSNQMSQESYSSTGPNSSYGPGLSYHYSYSQGSSQQLPEMSSGGSYSSYYQSF